ncbi:MAG: MFS transporter [Gammaproteobacteria bacterium]|nr:MFS transporter [Gammaproteobacteria bacterium]
MSNILLATSQHRMLAGCYFIYFAFLGLVIPYWGSLLNARGFNSAEIGELLAIFMATRIVMPTIWASIADKNGQRIEIVKAGVLLALLFFCGLFFVSDYWWIALVLALYASCWSAILPQIEVITLASLGNSSHQYSKIRAWGSVGYITTVTIAGVFVATIGVEAILPLAALLMLGLVFITQRINYQESPEPLVNQTSIWPLLKSKNIMLFFGANLLLQISHGPYYSFFVLYLAQHGYSEMVAGAQISLGVVAEIVVFTFCARLIARFGAKKLLLVSALLTIVRWLLTPLAVDNLWSLALVQLLHAASFGTAHAASMVFLHHWFSGNHRGRGQAIYASVCFGFGGTFGVLAAGYLWQGGEGATITWLGAALISVLALLFVCLIQCPQALQPKTGNQAVAT